MFTKNMNHSYRHNIHIKDIDIYNVTDLHHIFDIYNIYNNIKADKSNYILTTNIRNRSQNYSLPIFNTRFIFNTETSVDYAIRYLQAFYENQEKILEFIRAFYPVNCITYITPSKTSSILKFIDGIVESSNIDLTDRHIAINKSMLEYFSPINDKKFCNTFKNINISYKSYLPYEFNKDIRTCYLSLRTPFVSLVNHQVPLCFHKFLTYNNSEKYLNRIKVKCLQKI